MIPTYENGKLSGYRMGRADMLEMAMLLEASALRLERAGDLEGAARKRKLALFSRRSAEFQPAVEPTRIDLPKRLKRESRAAIHARWKRLRGEARGRARKVPARAQSARAPRRQRASTSRPTASASSGTDGPCSSGDDSDPPARLPRLDSRDSFSLDQAATATDLAPSTLCEAIARGALRAEKVGGGSYRARWSIAHDDLAAFYVARQAAERRTRDREVSLGVLHRIARDLDGVALLAVIQTAARLRDGLADGHRSAPTLEKPCQACVCATSHPPSERIAVGVRP